MTERDRHTVDTQYWHKLEDGRIQCELCPRLCKLHTGQRGLCFVRQNPDDTIVLMRGIIKSITSPAVPVASYVAPTGARAASAGTYILYASHIAAMAPGTNVGAATPIRIGGVSQPDSKGKDEQGKPADATVPDAGRKKMINDAVAYLRSLVELRGRNPEWAEKAVREAAGIPASEALQLGPSVRCSGLTPVPGL